jgi:uncharacterized damage-inducible protein DinB
MDRPAIEELFAYTDWTWRQHEAAIRPLGDDALVKPVPGSGWPALRNALAHTAWAYDKWVSLLTSTAPAGLEVESVRSWKDLEDYRRGQRGRLRDYLHSLTDAELTTISWAVSSDGSEVRAEGEKLVYSPADLLANILLHEREHHGDINTLLYQIGVEVPQTAYRFFLLESRRLT